MNAEHRAVLGPGPYILVQDDDAHWYVIPQAKHVRWAVWNRSEEAELGIPPEWALALGGSPSNVSFTDFEAPSDV